MTTTAQTAGVALRCDLLGYCAYITIPDPAAYDAAAQVLGAFRPARAIPVDAPHYTLTCDYGLWTVSRPGTRFATDGELTNGLLALEWQLVTDALAARSDLFHLHAAALATPDNGAGVLIVGDSGSGKTTLVLALMQRGFLPYSDDVALLDPSTLRLRPFPRAFHVREGTYALLDDGPGAPTWDEATMPHGFFLPPQYATASAPVRLVLFPTLRPGQPLELVPLGPGESAPLLLTQTLTLTESPTLALGTAARLTGAADCYRLFTGDLTATADRVAALAIGTATRTPTVAP